MGDEAGAAVVGVYDGRAGVGGGGVRACSCRGGGDWSGVSEPEGVRVNLSTRIAEKFTHFCRHLRLYLAG